MPCEVVLVRVDFFMEMAKMLKNCDEWDRIVALPRHKFVTGATLLQLVTRRTEIDET